MNNKITLLAITTCTAIALFIANRPIAVTEKAAARDAESGNLTAVETSSPLAQLPKVAADDQRKLAKDPSTVLDAPMGLGRTVHGSVTSSSIDVATLGSVLAWNSNTHLSRQAIEGALAGETVDGLWVSRVSDNGEYRIDGLPEDGAIAIAALAPSSFSDTSILPKFVPTEESVVNEAVKQDLRLHAVFVAHYRVVDLETGGPPFCSPDFFHGPSKRSTVGDGRLLTGVDGDPLLSYLAGRALLSENNPDRFSDVALLSSKTAEAPSLAFELTLPGYLRGNFEIPSAPVSRADGQPFELRVRRTADTWGTVVVQLDDSSSVAAADLVGGRNQAVVRFGLGDGTHYGKSIPLLGTPVRLTLPARTYDVSALSLDDIGRVGLHLSTDVLEVPAGGEVELRASAAELGHVQIFSDGPRGFHGDAEVWIRIRSVEGGHGTRRITADSPFLFGLTEGRYEMAIWRMGGVSFRDQLVYSEPFTVQPRLISACLLPLP